MRYLILIILSALTTNREVTFNFNRDIKEKREYDVEVQPNGSTIRKLKMTTNYSNDGQVISETEACSDSSCCYYNKSFTLHKNKNEYWYREGRLILRVFRTCNSLPSCKDFHEYEFDNKNRLAQEKELTFNYETENEKYEKGKWVPAKIGDSILTEINIHQYTYNKFDSLIEEKITIQKKYPDKKNISWKVTYQYDKNKNLVKIQQPVTINASEARFYDEKNRLVKIKSNLTGDNVTTEIVYDANGNISSIREQINDQFVKTKYQYNSNKLLISEESEGDKIQSVIIKYFYNELNDIMRKETSYDKKTPFIQEYQYTYY